MRLIEVRVRRRIMRVHRIQVLKQYTGELFSFEREHVVWIGN